MLVEWSGFFDEVHMAETYMEYSLLWEAAIRHSVDLADECFLVLGAFATLSSRMRDCLREYGVSFIACGHKPYSVNRGL